MVCLPLGMAYIKLAMDQAMHDQLTAYALKCKHARDENCNSFLKNVYAAGDKTIVSF